jgi:hypothetical protein
LFLTATVSTTLALNPRTLETIIAIVVLASTWIGPEMGAVSGAGCEGTILDGAGRVVVVAVETGAAENPRITVSFSSRDWVCR